MLPVTNVLTILAAIVSNVSQTIIDRLVARDARALREIYARWNTRAMGLAFTILGSRNEAEDIVQESFMQVWEKAASYDAARGGVGAWISTIVRTRAIDRLRSRRASHARDVKTGEEAQRDPDAQVAPPPLEDIESRQLRARVQAAMKDLPDDQRMVVELAYFKGLSQSEIAAEIGEPLGTIKSRIRLAMTKLSVGLRELADA